MYLSYDYFIIRTQNARLPQMQLLSSESVFRALHTSISNRKDAADRPNAAEVSIAINILPEEVVTCRAVLQFQTASKQSWNVISVNAFIGHVL